MPKQKEMERKRKIKQKLKDICKMIRFGHKTRSPQMDGNFPSNCYVAVIE